MPGFESIDWPEFRWGESPIPFPDETFNEVYASHVLEHVAWYQTVGALEEAHRVLKPGGILEVWVPDFRRIIAAYMLQECGDDWRKFNKYDDPMQWVNGRLFAYGPEPNWHRQVFDRKRMREHMASIFPFHDFVARTRGRSHGPVEIGVRAYK